MNYEAYRPATSLTSLQPGTVANVGGSQAHLNMQPFLTISFCIALQGIFPSGWPAIATAATAGILLNLLFVALKPLEK